MNQTDKLINQWKESALELSKAEYLINLLIEEREGAKKLKSISLKLKRDIEIRCDVDGFVNVSDGIWGNFCKTLDT